MRLFEDEAKILLKSNGINLPVNYGSITNVEQITEKLKDAEYPIFLKALVLSGGRGKAGGVKKASNLKEAIEHAKVLFELTIKGFPVHKLLLEKAATDVIGECYVGATMDPKSFRPVIMVSSCGGVEIEQVAKTNPEMIMRYELGENEMDFPFEKAREFAKLVLKQLKISEPIEEKFAKIIQKLYESFQQFDARTLEINPLLILKRDVLAVDAKLVLDDNALFRHADLLEMCCGSATVQRHDVAERTANETRAQIAGFPYVDLLDEGFKADPEKLYVGLVPGGAGYGIFSIDEVANIGDRYFEGRVVPVNFMDSGGGPKLKAVAEMFHMLMDYSLVDLIITSRFGGVSSCDTFIKGLIMCLRDRFKEKKRIVPVHGRMVGTDLPSARAYLDAAFKETPEPLEHLKIAVGNQKIMIDIIKGGVEDAFKVKKLNYVFKESQSKKLDQSIIDSQKNLEMTKCPSGMLHWIIKKRRPELYERIMKNGGKIQTCVVGLGAQGTKHAKLMQDYGTEITAGIAAGRGGTKIHETIPVFNTMAECIKEFPDIAAASIWRHYSTARDAIIEVIEAGVPLITLITEFIPLRDVRDILVACKKHNTLLFGGNTPGVIFPPEGIKVGMLPDVFHPDELSPGIAGPKGVTIISRSGAILYHMSDAMASVGIAQNAILGVGGDGANGSTFVDLVPMAMEYPNTDLVIVAGEIGGMKEELLAADIKNNPKKYPKPLLALISGKHAPEGKTMGHAGAIVAPGEEYGTWQSKRDALSKVGVTVVNCQYDLIAEAQKILKNKEYFVPERYFARQKKIWEKAPIKPTWGTTITKVEPNKLTVCGFLLEKVIADHRLLEAVFLLFKERFPTAEEFAELEAQALKGLEMAAPEVKFNSDEDLSKLFAKCFMLDDSLIKIKSSSINERVMKTCFVMGRAIRYLATIMGHELKIEKGKPIGGYLYQACTGHSGDASHEQLIEKMVIACIDHGVTPPSAQATLIAANVRASYEVGVAHGIGAITDVHGGAGSKAALIFRNIVEESKKSNINLRKATRLVYKNLINSGVRIEGMGHRVHTKDPRRDILWKITEDLKLNKECVEISRFATDVFTEVRGMTLPINVDGVLGAIVADLGMDAVMAKAIFIMGRIAGLSAHYFEEISSQQQMRRINFGDAVYKGK